jgi:nucleoside-diphosphate-sugar epimerase
MRLLVLGGTAWLSSHVALAALERGHEVTCLARGEAGRAPDGVTFVRADRNADDAYDKVASTEWDAVVDVARHPGHVRTAVAALEPVASTYVFVSTGNVYASTTSPGDDESAELLPPLDGDVMTSMEAYGPAKVACEQRLLATFGPNRTVIARSGLIGGPGDVSDRTGYWPWRFANPASSDGRVLTPDVTGQMTQIIDVRDAASWLVEVGLRRAGGVFNMLGDTMPLDEYLAVARQVAGHTGELVVADPDWLVAQGVDHYMGKKSLPLWLPMPEYAGWSTRDAGAARANGLVCRPVAETLADTLAWERTLPPDRQRKAGLTDDEERDLLNAAAKRA